MYTHWQFHIILSTTTQHYKQLEFIIRCNIKSVYLSQISTIGWMDIRCIGFSKIFPFLERVPIKIVEPVKRLNFKLQFDLICSIRICSRNRDFLEKPLYLVSHPHVLQNLVLCCERYTFYTFSFF